MAGGRSLNIGTNHKCPLKAECCTWRGSELCLERWSTPTDSSSDNLTEDEWNVVNPSFRQTEGELSEMLHNYYKWQKEEDLTFI